MIINVEVTDTFQGEANYSWVRKYLIEVPEELSNRALIRRVKEVTGHNGIRHKPVRETFNGMTLHFYGLCHCINIIYPF